MKKLIYAADDEVNITDIMKSFLEDAGYSTKTFSTGDGLYDTFIKEPCDLVILDIMMPGSDGLSICKKIREISTVPIIILTAKDSEMDYLMGINYGGDDYLIKPFRPSLLVLKIKAIFRRIDMERESDTKEEKNELRYGDLLYSENAHKVTCNNSDVKLTMTELACMKYLMMHVGAAVSRTDLLDSIWGIKSDVETRVADETIRRIRKKLKSCNSAVNIGAIWGYGYRLSCDE